MLKDGIRTRSYMNAIMNNSFQVWFAAGAAILHLH